MSRDVVDKWCERGILGLVLAILVYGPLAMGAVRVPEYLVLQGATLAVLVLWGVRLWLKLRPQLLWTPLCWAVVGFTLYAVVRYFTSEIEYAARAECIQVLHYAFLFLAVVNNLHRQEHGHVIVLTLVFLAMAISGYAIYQFATQSNKVWIFDSPYKGRASGTYISPNNLAGFLEMVLPLGATWVLVSRAKPVLKVFVGYACLVILAGIAVTLSRGGWVAVCVTLIALFAVLLRHRNFRIPAAVVLICLAVGGAYLLPKAQFLKKRVQEMSANDRLNDSARLILWQPAVRLWRESPWWGIGPNHYNYRWREVRPQEVQQQPDRVHNDYLNTLTDWGVAGLVLVLSGVVLLFAGVAKTWKSVRGGSADLGGGSSNKFALLLGGSLSVVAILVHSIVDFNMHIPANAAVLVTIMALVSGLQRFSSSNYWVSLDAVPRLLFSIVLAAGLGSLGWYEVRVGREYVAIERAGEDGLDPQQRLAALKAAFEAEPKNFQTAYEIGEALRRESLEGDAGYEEKAQDAIKWFQRSIALNRFHGYSYLGWGMCLDWIGKRDESWSYYDKAVRLDPNGYFTAANVGWHYVQVGDYAAARVWFERSRRLEWIGNTIADNYLPIVQRRLLERASGEAILP